MTFHSAISFWSFSLTTNRPSANAGLQNAILCYHTKSLRIQGISYTVFADLIPDLPSKDKHMAFEIWSSSN